MVKTQDAIRLASGARKLAEVLGVSTQAVYLWHDHLPQPRVYELMVKKPEWFDAKGELVKPKKKGKL